MNLKFRIFNMFVCVFQLHAKVFNRFGLIMLFDTIPGKDFYMDNGFDDFIKNAFLTIIPKIGEIRMKRF